MNGISTDALVGLLGVALGAIVSLIGVWVEGRREARRVADQRRYERVRDRIDRLEPHIARVNGTSNELRDATEGLTRWTLSWWQTPAPDRPRITSVVEQYLSAMRAALEKADTVVEEEFGIILDSLEPEILDAFHELQLSFRRLYGLAQNCLLEREISPGSRDVEWIENWAKEWNEIITTEHETFKEAYKTLVIAIGNALGGSYPHPSWLQRLREWWGRR